MVPGHTHEDVDQLFSSLMTNLRHKRFLKADLNDVMKLLQSEVPTNAAKQADRANLPRVLTDLAPYMRDYTSWLAPWAPDLAGISFPHAFKIEEIPNSSGSIGCSWKMWGSMHGPWLGNAGSQDPIPLLGQQDVPGEPARLQPMPPAASTIRSITEMNDDPKKYVGDEDFKTFQALFTQGRQLDSFYKDFNLKHIADRVNENHPGRLATPLTPGNHLEYPPAATLVEKETQKMLQNTRVYYVTKVPRSRTLKT